MSFPNSTNRHADFTITVTSDQDLSGDIGKSVVLTGMDSYEIDLGSNGETVLGELLYFSGDTGTVRVQGICTLPYTGTAPSVGDMVVSAGTGLVRVATTTEIQNGAARGTVLSTDTSAVTVDVLL